MKDIPDPRVGPPGIEFNKKNKEQKNERIAVHNSEEQVHEGGRLDGLAGETPPPPSLTVTGVHNEETEPPAIYAGRSILFDGTSAETTGTVHEE